MNKDFINEKIKSYLANQYEFNIEELNKKGLNIIKSDKQNKIKMILFKNCYLVITPEKDYDFVYNSIKDKSKYEIFEFPYVYGQSICYAPDMERIERIDEPDGYKYRMFDKDIGELNLSSGFENAISYKDGKCTSKIAYVAYDEDRIIGVAGADELNSDIWEVGIEVLPEYRGLGIATALSNNLTLKILEKGIIPIWSASSTNIGSQIVACRSGYIPNWYESYSDVFDEKYKYKKLINIK